MVRITLIILFVTLFSDFCIAKSAESEELSQKVISANNPTYIYLLETEDHGGPVDSWDGWISLKDYARELQLHEFEKAHIYEPPKTYHTTPHFMAILNAFRATINAAEAVKEMRCDGDIRGEEAYIAFKVLPRTYTLESSLIVKEHMLEENQYAFGWKQDSKGRSYIVSPIVLKELEACPYVNIDKAEDATSVIEKGMGSLTMSPKKSESIYMKYQKVSSKFLNGDKRKFINPIALRAFEDFTIEYDCAQPSVIDITYFSFRTRVYLLTQIINFKLARMAKVSFWKKKIQTISPSKSSVPITYDEWVDLVPTKFRIGQYEYTLKNVATTKKPGGGRLYGLTEADQADTYEKISRWLREFPPQILLDFKTELRKRQQGYKIRLIKQDRTEDVKVNQLLNGLSLLFDFEVARRLVEGDQFRYLPVLPAMLYLFENFEDISLVKSCFDSFFSGDNRKDFIEKTVIKSRSNLDTEKAIRNSLKMLHTTPENSDDEYEDD